MAQRIGLVLAGGAGRRIGGPKGELVLGPSSLAERASSILWPLCGSVLISTRPGERNPVPGHATLPDPLPAGRFAIRTWSTNGWWDDVEFGGLSSGRGR